MSPKTLVVLFAAFAPLMQACGSGDNDGTADGGKNTQSACQITLSGAMSGTYSCFNAPFATHVEASNITSLSVTSDGTPKRGSVGIIITHSFIGAPATGTYAGTGPNQYGWAVGVTQNPSSTWSAASESILGNTGGSYSLTISALAPKDEVPGAHSYYIHGTLHAKALADTNTGASGEVTLDAVF